MEKYTVTIVNLGTKEEMKIVVNADEGETSDNIILSTTLDGEDITASHYSYLPAYQSLRDCLLQKGYGVKCNGSRLNAIQSGMMSANNNIYLAELGKQAMNENMANIYEYADIDEFPDTLEQMQFFRMWMKSLTERKEG